ncbi:MAG TPA: erythromycin esterase family protein [Rugosimonospora sp.]|nr:erythromycin esterase family protein [Rugosimonospora sp.]
MAGEHLFRDRRDAGRALVGLLDRYRERSDVVVLALPGGGVPVAYEVALELDVPLDVSVVRRLGVPGHEALAMGAVAGGVVVLDDDVVRALGVAPGVLREVAEREGRELARHERAYREGRAALAVAGKVVLLVDDGLATGVSLRAAVQALRRSRPAGIVVAVPAASESTCRELGATGVEVVCATTPSPFLAAGEAYWGFARTTDGEVRDLLRTAARTRPAGTGTPGRTAAAAIRAVALPVAAGVPADEVLFDLVGDARFVVIGEASAGTHEFSAARARMTRRLIEAKGFCAVAVEADWPDAYRLNRFVLGRGGDATAADALRGFAHFPAWRWRNPAVVDFAGWLRGHNDRAGRAAAGCYGLDRHCLYRSVEEVIAYLARVDPAAAEHARQRYACLDHTGDGYGSAAAFGAGEEHEREMLARLDGDVEYHRSLFAGRVSAWNTRARHLSGTLDALAGRLTRQRGQPARVVVWAHNSHAGDARATELGSQGGLSIGQLVRERHPGDCCLIGFSTYTGTVTAADDWGGPAERKRVPPALPDSVAELCHGTGEKEFLIRLSQAPGELRAARLERAIGVVYRPDTERHSHYSHARLADEYDALVHLDETRALEPLERTAGWERGEAPGAYPFPL